MPKTLVTYFSLTGNTKLIAETIHDALHGDKTLDTIGRIPDPSLFELVFIGFPVHSHSLPYKVEEFMKKIPAGKKVAFFCTHGSLPESRLSREAIEYASVILAKTRLLGTFACRGKVSLQALDILRRSPEHEEWADMAASAATHPDSQDVSDAEAFARWIQTLSAHGRYGTV